MALLLAAWTGRALPMRHLHRVSPDRVGGHLLEHAHLVFAGSHEHHHGPHAHGAGHGHPHTHPHSHAHAHPHPPAPRAPRPVPRPPAGVDATVGVDDGRLAATSTLLLVLAAAAGGSLPRVAPATRPRLLRPASLPRLAPLPMLAALGPRGPPFVDSV